MIEVSLFALLLVGLVLLLCFVVWKLDHTHANIAFAQEREWRRELDFIHDRIDSLHRQLDIVTTGRHARESWLYDNPEAVVSVLRGLAQSVRDDGKSFGNFAQYTRDDDTREDDGA